MLNLHRLVILLRLNKAFVRYVVSKKTSVVLIACGLTTPVKLVRWNCSSLLVYSFYLTNSFKLSSMQKIVRDHVFRVGFD